MRLSNRREINHQKPNLGRRLIGGGLFAALVAGIITISPGDDESEPLPDTTSAGVRGVPSIFAFPGTEVSSNPGVTEETISLKNETTLPPNLLNTIFSSLSIENSGADIMRLDLDQQKLLFLELRQRGLLPFLIQARKYFDKISRNELLELISSGGNNQDTNLLEALKELKKTGEFTDEEIILALSKDIPASTLVSFISSLGDNPYELIRKLVGNSALKNGIYLNLYYFARVLSPEQLESLLQDPSNPYRKSPSIPETDESRITRINEALLSMTTDSNYSKLGVYFEKEDYRFIDKRILLENMMITRDYISILENRVFLGIPDEALPLYANTFLSFNPTMNHPVERIIRVIEKEKALHSFIPRIVTMIQASGDISPILSSDLLIRSYGGQRIFDELFYTGQFLTIGTHIFRLSPSLDSAKLLATQLSNMKSDDIRLAGSPLGNVWRYIKASGG